MRRRNRPYTRIEHGVLVDDQLLANLCAENLRPVFDKKRNKEYPVIVNERNVTVDVLHRRLALLLFGAEKVNDERYVVHHRSGNKKNCRAENIEMRLRGDHLRLHRLQDKKEIENDKNDVFGLWCPREKRPLKKVNPDLPLLEREDGKTARETYSAPTTWKIHEAERLSMKALVWLAEEALEEAFERLDRETRHLDSGIPIPKAKTVGGYRDQNSKDAGVEPVRLGCFKSEAALVRACVKHRRPDGTFDMDAVSADVGIESEVLAHLSARPAVWLAVERWRLYKRLPKPCKPGWPGNRPR
jgi:hypothetical protein